MKMAHLTECRYRSRDQQPCLHVAATYLQRSLAAKNTRLACQPDDTDLITNGYLLVIIQVRQWRDSNLD